MLLSFLRFFQSDARHFQIVSQTIFVCIGVMFLRWDYSFISILLTFGTALSIQLLGIYLLKLPLHSIKSALITAFGLTLLFKSNEPMLFALAAAIAIGQKFILKIWSTSAIFFFSFQFFVQFHNSMTHTIDKYHEKA